jgi:hypothetical protein
MIARSMKLLSEAWLQDESRIGPDDDADLIMHCTIDQLKSFERQHSIQSGKLSEK